MKKGDVLGGWTIGRELSRDSRGVLHEAADARGRAGRVQVVSAPALMEGAVRSALLRSAIAAQSLHSPGIVPVWDVRETSGAVGLVMPAAVGPSLPEILSQQTLSEMQILELAEDIARSLEDAARQGVAHGHIRAEDIRRAPGGNWVLEGIGCSCVDALVIGKAPPPAMEELLSDRPEYAAPDLLRGGTLDLHHADQYALGAVLYHALTGRAPFAGGRPSEIFGKHKFGQLENPSDVRATCPPELAMLVERLMSRSPEDRFRDAFELHEAVRAVRAGRMPPGSETWAAGRSTVRPPVRAGKPAPQETSSSRKKLLVTAVPEVAVGETFKRSRHDNSGLRIMAIVFLILGGLIWAWWRYGGTHGIPQFPVNIPPPASTRTAAAPTVSESVAPAFVPAHSTQPPASGLPLELPAAKPRRPQEPIVIRSPNGTTTILEPEEIVPAGEGEETKLTGIAADAVYQEASRIFNEAVRIFRGYTDSREAVPGLNRVPKLAETAAEKFQQCLPRASGDDAAKVKKHIDHAYKIAMAARQALLLTGGSEEGKPSSAKPTPTPAHRPGPVVPAPPAPPPQQQQLRLPAGWNLAPMDDGPAVADWKRLLEGRAKVATDTMPDPALRFGDGAPYLTGEKDLAAALKLGKFSGRSFDVTLSVFPPRSFTAIEYESAVDPAFSAARLIVDGFNHVAAVQWIGEQPRDGLWLPSALFTPDYQTFDLITGEAKPASDTWIAHRVRVTGRMIQIDSEMATADRSRSLGRRSLLLPQPMADIIFSRLVR